MKRKRPSFNESYYGFRTFSHLLEDAQRRGLVTLRRDQKSGSYIIEDVGVAAKVETAAGVESPAERKPEAAAGAAGGGEDTNGGRPGRRRRGRGGRGRRGGIGAPVPAGAHSEAGASPIEDADDEEDDADDATPEPSRPVARENSAATAEPERPAFSLFSWLRREPEDKKP
jgi:hypothetical protein